MAKEGVTGTMRLVQRPEGRREPPVGTPGERLCSRSGKARAPKQSFLEQRSGGAEQGAEGWLVFSGSFMKMFVVGWEILTSISS